jgi:hypothetical protein
MRINRVRNQAQMIGNNKISSRQELFLKFKGTPPQEDNKTGFSIFTIIESALFGQVGIILQTVSPQDLFCGFSL